MQANEKKSVLILGASDRPERYAHKALKMLQAHGYTPLLVNPGLKMVEDQPVLPDFSSLNPGSVDTVTLYVGPKILEKQIEALLQLKPRRVIFNPGTEQPELQAKLQEAGILPVVACTLVLLSTKQFEAS